MGVRLTTLPWLPPAPADFRPRLKAARAEPEGFLRAAQALARHALDLNALHSLSRAVDDWLATPAGQAAAPLRLAILSNGTTDLLRSALQATLLRHGLVGSVWVPPFGQVAQQVLDPSSDLNRSDSHFVLLALDHRGLPLQPCPGEATQAAAAVDAALAQVRELAQGVASRGATPVVQTLPAVPDTLFGHLDRSVPGTQAVLIDAFNQGLRRDAASWGCLLLDCAALAERVGLDDWHDPVQWAHGKFPLAMDALPLYADHIARLIAAARGKARKCLVLDLDNTVWGGVIGDDGMGGIALGQGSALGEAHLEVQRVALQLRARGIVLAVSSKNDDAVARAPFREHPEMLLKEEHIAVFQANWLDKASNLRVIAQTLNIGVDALVLLDDNPAERAQVRLELPEVGVPELPEDAAYFVRNLLAAGYFESTGFTAEDRERAEQYRSNAARAALEGSTSNVAEYLDSLAMVATFSRFDAVGRARITQLINKTNQFNLTTRRYTEAQVQAVEDDAAGLGLQIRLADRFGDNGMISVIVCRAEGDSWLIDTWLMSCRVLNRKVEQATLNELCAQARQRGVRRLVGEYIASGRNGMVAEHYAKLGFTPLAQSEAGSRWVLELADVVPPAVPMQIEWR